MFSKTVWTLPRIRLWIMALILVRPYFPLKMDGVSSIKIIIEATGLLGFVISLRAVVQDFLTSSLSSGIKYTPRRCPSFFGIENTRSHRGNGWEWILFPVIFPSVWSSVMFLRTVVVSFLLLLFSFPTLRLALPFLLALVPFFALVPFIRASRILDLILCKN